MNVGLTARAAFRMPNDMLTPPRSRARAPYALCAILAGTSLLAATPPRDAPLLLTQIPVPAPGGAAPLAGSSTRQPELDGARVVVLQPDGMVRVLSEGFRAAADPDLSFDARTVLFAGRKEAGSHWRVYEVGLDGLGLRAVTPEGLDARNPIHVSTLFTLDSPEPWFTTVFVGTEASSTGPSLRNSLPVWNLYNIKLDGGELRRLTWTPHSSQDPCQMWDGRVVYAAGYQAMEPVDAPYREGLFGIHIEGADMERFGAEEGRAFQRMPCATDGGLVVFIESATPTADGSGQLACVTQRRPHVEYRRLTEDSDRVYSHPYPWKANTVLVSSRLAEGSEAWALWTYDADNSKGELLHEDPRFHELQARLVRPRPRPDGHSTVVNMTATNGTIYGLNCYTADSRLASGMRTGEVKRVRFIEGVVAGTAGGTLPRRLVGEAPVEPDGSFNVEVPASTPLLLQSLDERGLALATCGWIWVQPKETRGCIGCHEDPERIPENEYVLALRRPSTQLTLPPTARRTVTFRDHIAPLLREQCALADCHGGRDTPLQLELAPARPGPADLERAYHLLLAPAATPGEAASRPYVIPGRARASPLVWHLFATNTTRPWDSSGPAAARPTAGAKLMPPANSGRVLRPEEIHTVVQWIDLGAAYDATGGPPEGTPLQQVEAR